MRCFNYESGRQGGWPRSQATSGSEPSKLTRRRLERFTGKRHFIHCRMISYSEGPSQHRCPCRVARSNLHSTFGARSMASTTRKS